MTTYFVTRHPGAQEWAARHGHQESVLVSHFDPAVIQYGDTVLGTLPVHLAAEVCRRGAHYYHLSMEVPASLRGQEITAEVMEALGARLEEFLIVACPFGRTLARNLP